MLTAEESTDNISTPGPESPETQSGSAPAKEVDPYAGRVVTHSKIGVWDWYEERYPDGYRLFSAALWKKKYSDIILSYPYVWRMVKDVIRIPGCKTQLIIYLSLELVSSLIPAASTW